MKRTYDVAVIGAGIVGLAYAWMAVRRGLSVVLFDRSPRACGATVRNFGMIWPIGQPAGDLYATAMRSRELWRELAADRVVNVDECGAVHLAHRDDELAVLQEFCGAATHDCQLLSPEETLAAVPVANPAGLRGGLWSPTELRVDPRNAAANLAAWLATEHGVEVLFSQRVVSASGGRIVTGDGECRLAERTVICSGSDLHTLYPSVLQASGLRVCKLQMLRTVAQRTETRQAAHIASGLTLRHYASFVACPGLQRLRERVARETPELDRLGIHVLATQSASSEFILGDSHEYDDDISPFDKAEIDDLILREVRKIVQLPELRITERWHGQYAKHPELPIFETEVEQRTHICVGPGGAGMTMSFGLAERSWNRWEGATPDDTSPG